MLFKQDVLRRIATGEITLAFRRWRRPSVKSGGTLLTPIGQLAIESVATIEPDRLNKREAERAGFASLEALRSELEKQRTGTLYRIAFHRAGDDPRLALRNSDDLSKAEIEKLSARLDRLDARTPRGPWTRQILRLIGKFPERKAGELAKHAGFEKEWLKLNVRKLKNLGLTESLNPGYRLSPRGQMLLDEMGRERD